MTSMEKFEDTAFEIQMETYQKVVELIARGKRPSEIESETGVPPAAQREIYKKFEDYANNDFQTQRRAKAIIAELDAQYTYLIRELETVVENAELEGDWKLKKDTLKELANVNKMRAEQLQRAGILNSEAVGAEIAAMEEEHGKILELLKKVALACKDDPRLQGFKRMIIDGIADIRGEVVEVKTQDVQIENG